MGALQIINKVGKWIQDNKAASGAFAGATGAGTIGLNDLFSGPDILPDNLKGGDVVVQFPEDNVSGGDFWTELTFFSWKRSKNGVHLDDDTFDGVNTQSSTTKTDFLGICKLPMPLQLSTGYSGRFSEADNMSVDRDGTGTMGDLGERVGGIFTGLGLEIKAAGNALANLNNTAKMSNASINNNHMGMQYEGANLRGHSFSWRLSAKNASEQLAIQKVIFYLKAMSLPANNWGGAEDFEFFKQTLEGMSMSADEGVKIPKLPSDATAESTGGGRLTIPPTVAIRFLDGDNENESLFKIKDSFITNVEVNYTSSGTWTPHVDGSPMEVQINITLKEVKMITRKDVLAGY